MKIKTLKLKLKWLITATNHYILVLHNFNDPPIGRLSSDSSVWTLTAFQSSPLFLCSVNRRSVGISHKYYTVKLLWWLLLMCFINFVYFLKGLSLLVNIYHHYNECHFCALKLQTLQYSLSSLKNCLREFYWCFEGFFCGYKS